MGGGCTKFFVAILVWLQLLCLAALAEAEPVVLTTHNLYPYSYLQGKNTLTGLAADVVHCVFERMKQPYEIRVVPWKRAQFMVRNGKADGFFAGSQNSDRDNYAKMSAIIADQKWMWFFKKKQPFRPKDPQFKTKMIVSSFQGANMQKWLVANGYTVSENPPKDTLNLLRMLMADRIDAALANNEVMTTLLDHLTEKNTVISALNRNKPLGVYFSKEFLASRPLFLETFDSHVRPCRHTAVKKSYSP